MTQRRKAGSIHENMLAIRRQLRVMGTARPLNGVGGAHCPTHLSFAGLFVDCRKGPIQPLVAEHTP